MPELPEVETIRRQLAQHVGGRTITDVEVLDPLLVDPEDPRSFEHRVSGRSIEALRRTGKYLFVDLDGGEALALHLRMTGQLLWSASEPLEPTPYARAVFRIDDGSVVTAHGVAAPGWTPCRPGSPPARCRTRCAGARRR